MNAKLTLLLVLCLVLTACGAQPTVVPLASSTPANTFTPLPPPTETPLPSPTPVPPTPTFGPPLPVVNVTVASTKCVVTKPTIKDPHYYVNISFILTWVNQSSNEDGFYIYRDGNRVAELGPGVTTYTDIFEPHKPGKFSTYIIVAYNSTGQAKSDPLPYPNPC